MCTAISFSSVDHYFGRTLDLEYHYDEQVVVTPRNHGILLRKGKPLYAHFAMIGTATVAEDTPLYYDATNEKGLSAAALNFPDNAVYLPPSDEWENVASFELIPWLLGQCADLQQARARLACLRVTDEPFSDRFAPTPLHWLIADRTGAVVVEQTARGLEVHDNPVGVLTNNPPFPYHMTNLVNYQNLTREEPTDRFGAEVTLTAYSRGMGSVGLPGDVSSASRFVRAAFVKSNSVCDGDEAASVSQFFHILGAVEQVRGCVRVGDAFERTVYTSCCNTDKGIYYYTTYENRQITAVDMHREDLDGSRLIVYPHVRTEQIARQN